MRIVMAVTACLLLAPVRGGDFQGNADKLWPVTYYARVVDGKLEMHLWQNSRVWLNGARVATRQTPERADTTPRLELIPGDVLTFAPDLLTRYNGLPKEGRLFTQLRLERAEATHAWFVMSKFTSVAEPLADGSARYRRGRLISQREFEANLAEDLIDGKPIAGVLVGGTKYQRSKR